MSRSNPPFPWHKSAAFYQIYPRSFQDSNADGIGDLRGIMRRLDYIRDLGVDAVWLCPIYQSPNDDNGYDISDYRAINPDYGTMDDFMALMDGLHRRGIRLVMDMVLNHTSDEHAWFRESASSRESSRRGWYVWRSPSGAGPDGKPVPPNGWTSMFSGSAWEYHAGTGQFYLHSFSRKQPDLNWENPEVREALYEMMRWWLEKGVDGFRLDVINFISKRLPPAQPQSPGDMGSTDIFRFFANGPRVHEYLAEMNHEVFRPFGAVAIGETPGVDPLIAAEYTDPGRHELDMVFQFELMDVDHGPGGKWDVRRAEPRAASAVMRKWQCGPVGWNTLYWNNHDQPRLISRFGDEGRRELSGKALAALLYLQKGSPFIYQGEEIGMVNAPLSAESDLRDVESINYLRSIRSAGALPPDAEARAWAAVRARGRDNARTPFQWDSGTQGGFSDASPWISVNPNYRAINAEESLARADSLLAFYRRLLALRKEERLVTEGEIQFMDTADDRLIIYRRFPARAASVPGYELLVACNMSGDELMVHGSGPRSESHEIVLRNYEDTLFNGTWRPWELVVWRSNGH